MPGTLIHRLTFGLFLYVAVFAEQKEIEVSAYYAKVYVAPSTNANFIGLIQKGERYPVLGVRDSWYTIRFKNVNGWIEFSQAKVIDPYAEAAAAAPVQASPTDSVSSGEGAIAPSVDSNQAVNVPVRSTRDTTFSQNRTIGSGDNTEPRSIRTPTIARKDPASSKPSVIPQHSSSSKKSSEKKESGIRSWFSQQNTPELPPVINMNDEQEETVKFFKVTIPSPVREYLDPSSPIFGVTKRGQIFQLIGEGDMWCKIVFSGKIGWVEKKQGKIIDPEAAPTLDYVKIMLIAGLFLMGIILAFIVLLKSRNSRNVDTQISGASGKRVLIIGKSQKTIRYTLTNGTTSLDRCFSEVGFDVVSVTTFSAFKNTIRQSTPDVIMIDYQFDPNIITVVERMSISLGIAGTLITVLYNVPDPSVMQPGKVLTTMLFLGEFFSDRDVFKLITPILYSSDDTNIRKSVTSSALAGNIAEGNLLEVLQFIEIGSKTGTLLIELEKPSAIICFREGRINFAATADNITGRDAVFKVLELKKGKFRFVVDNKTRESNVNISTLEVLMEWTKKIDEAHGR